MLLQFASGSSITNQTFTDDYGRAVYMSETPSGIVKRTTTIRRANGDTVARIVFKDWGSPKIQFGHGGMELKADAVLRKTKNGGDARVFVGPDGREYKWIIGSTKPRLVTNDRTESLVATFHRHHTGFITSAQKASLEIFPSAEMMSDLILTTFVFVEKTRKDAETYEAVEGVSGAVGSVAG